MNSETKKQEYNPQKLPHFLAPKGANFVSKKYIKIITNLAKMTGYISLLELIYTYKNRRRYEHDGKILH